MLIYCAYSEGAANNLLIRLARNEKNTDSDIIYGDIQSMIIDMNRKIHSHHGNGPRGRIWRVSSIDGSVLCH
jgi:hypothetical protein